MRIKRVRRAGKYKIRMECHNCEEDMDVRYNKNRWVEWFSGECDTCGWRFILKDTEFDFIQPDDPFFEIIYKYVPGREVEMNKKKHAWEEEQRKMKLEEKYYKQYRSKSSKGSTVKPWEKRAIEKEVLNND